MSSFHQGTGRRDLVCFVMGKLALAASITALKWARELINDVLDIVGKPISIRYIITDKGGDASSCSMEGKFAKALETSKAKGDTGFQVAFLKG
ncbi:hypothetical protein JTB14_020432 [Gonioctena quinquepunctata]|nr:hypothetical protein JTB14_020432 [Gonioctena quinquepunctata]